MPLPPVPLPDATFELVSFVIWSNLLGTIEADQCCHEQALSPDLYGVGIHLELEQQQPAQLTHRHKSFLLQDHVAWSCPPADHALKPCPQPIIYRDASVNTSLSL